MPWFLVSGRSVFHLNLGTLFLGALSSNLVWPFGLQLLLAGVPSVLLRSLQVDWEAVPVGFEPQVSVERLTVIATKRWILSLVANRCLTSKGKIDLGSFETARRWRQRLSRANLSISWEVRDEMPKKHHRQGRSAFCPGLVAERRSLAWRPLRARNPVFYRQAPLVQGQG